MPTKDDHLVARDQHSSLSFHRQWELDQQDCPAVVRNIVLFNGIDSAVAFIATKDVDVAVFKDHCWHRASFLI